MKIFCFFLTLVLCFQAWSFPDFIRHGYTSCLVCHSSAAGGDMLSPYGKSISKELLSSILWPKLSLLSEPETAQKLEAEGEIPFLQVAGTLRLLQTFSESSIASKGRFMIMQVDVDSKININESNSFYVAIGRTEAATTEPKPQDYIYVPRAWYQFQKQIDQDSYLLFKAGRFYPNYGINMAEHSYVNRKYLGFNPGQERLAADLTWMNDLYQISLAYLVSRYAVNKPTPEAGYVVQVSQNINNRFKIGANVYNSKLGTSDNTAAISMAGVFAHLGWNEKYYSLVQLDQQSVGAGKTAVSDYLKLAYVPDHGFHFFLTQEYYNPNTEKSDPRIEAYGIGFQFFAAPGLDLLATLKLLKDSAQLDEFQRIAWMIGHFYF